MKIRPQILVAIVVIAALAGLVVVKAPDQTDKIVGGAITAIAMLGMKLLESE